MSQTADHTKVNILMVDDQPAKLLSYEAILGDLGENLVKANSAREALDTLLKMDVAVVLLDVSMPELDGFELAAMIRQHPRYEKTAIIFISAVLLTDFDRLRGYESGAVDYIPVPVVPELLRAKVRVFVDLYRKTWQLERLNAELEERVAMRTAELEASQKALRHLLEQETTARGEAETARAAAQAADRAKDEFLAVVSHELRSPLNAILGWSGVLKSQAEPAVRYRALEAIERNGRHQLRLIEDLMDAARVVGGKLRLEVRPVELATVVLAAFDSVRAAAEAKQIALLPDFEVDDVRMVGDPDRLQQIVWNLLSNAVKFTPEGGFVTVGLRCDGPYVVLVVTDTGKGIAPEFLPFVFDRFRQADSSTARRFGGLGLGLALVRHLVELHGGTVDARSDGEGHGATFEVRLPVRSVSAPMAARPATAGSRSRDDGPVLEGVRVLVVDDELDSRDFLATVLGGRGAEVVTAASTEEALGAIDRVPASPYFDALLTDIGMPDLDGYALLRAVRSSRREDVAAMPAIALTAYASKEDRARALEAGFQAHFAKPVDLAELVDTIHALVRNGGRSARADAANERP